MHTHSFPAARTGFFADLKAKVNAYFDDHDIHPAGNRPLLFKSVVLIFAAIGLYVTLVFFTPVVWVSLLLCVLLGLNLALIGFNVMHEGGHQSFSKHSWMNNISAHFLNVLGGNTYFWKVKHNVNHHTYTNIEGMDSDIDVKPFMRLHEGQPMKGYHRFQHIYWVILYGISYLVWVFYEDFQKYFSKKISTNSPRKELPAMEHFIFWTSKVAFVFFYMVLPALWIGWLPWLIGFLVITFVCGLAISIVFQLAHVVGETEFFYPQTGNAQHDWATHQLCSTADFATANKFLHWMLGGLNFQVEHHLFPRVSHIHYPVIAQHVKQTCHEYGIVYHEHKSMMSAVISHITHLRKLGRVA